MKQASAVDQSLSDLLYRWRWALSAGLLGAYVVVIQGTEADSGPLAWLLFLLLGVLVWLPALMRWARGVRAALTAFRDGLSGRE